MHTVDDLMAWAKGECGGYDDVRLFDANLHDGKAVQTTLYVTTEPACWRQNPNCRATMVEPGTVSLLPKPAVMPNDGYYFDNNQIH
jgi:hypothetical protein